jgi:hypothetical protein
MTSPNEGSTKSRYHELKLHPDPFGAVEDQTKTFEYRKDDRGFKVGDTLILREYHPLMAYTGRYLLRKVTYILADGFAVPAGYCVMSVRPLTQDEEADHAAGVKSCQ